MASITVQNIPRKTLSALESMAETHRRSLNSEVLFIFRWVAEQGSRFYSPGAEPEDSIVTRQKREMEGLIGSWDDDRWADQIISDIMKARTPGREVVL